MSGEAAVSDIDLFLKEVSKHDIDRSSFER